jgi:hypothetical protein
MSAVIVIISDSEDDYSLQHRCDDLITITPAHPTWSRSSAVSSGGGGSSKSNSVIDRSPVVIVPGTPPTPFAPEPIALSLPLQHAAAVGEGAGAIHDLNCR